MNYQLHYDLLISRAISANRKRYSKSDERYVYYEKHHIIPKCVSNNNEKNNLILLTAREHFVAHQLLSKIYKNTEYYYQLLCAIKMMCRSSNGQVRNNRMYKWIKESISEEQSRRQTGKKRSEETKRKMSENNYFNNGGKQLKGKDSPSYGLKRSDEVRKKISSARIGISTGIRSEETKQKMKDSRKLQTKTSQKIVVVFDIEYSSLKEACEDLNRNHKYIIHRLRSDKFPDCFYL